MINQMEPQKMRSSEGMPIDIMFLDLLQQNFLKYKDAKISEDGVLWADECDETITSECGPFVDVLYHRFCQQFNICTEKTENKNLPCRPNAHSIPMAHPMDMAMCISLHGDQVLSKYIAVAIMPTDKIQARGSSDIADFAFLMRPRRDGEHDIISFDQRNTDGKGFCTSCVFYKNGMCSASKLEMPISCLAAHHTAVHTDIEDIRPGAKEVRVEGVPRVAVSKNGTLDLVYDDMETQYITRAAAVDIPVRAENHYKSKPGRIGARGTAKECFGPYPDTEFHAPAKQQPPTVNMNLVSAWKSKLGLVVLAKYFMAYNSHFKRCANLFCGAIFETQLGIKCEHSDCNSFYCGQRCFRTYNSAHKHDAHSKSKNRKPPKNSKKNKN